MLGMLRLFTLLVAVILLATHPALARKRNAEYRKGFNSLWDTLTDSGQESAEGLRKPRPQGPMHRLDFSDKKKNARFKLYKGSMDVIEKTRLKNPNRRFKLNTNFFSVLSDDEKKLYLGVNMTRAGDFIQGTQLSSSVLSSSGSDLVEPPPPMNPFFRRKQDQKAKQKAKRETDTEPNPEELDLRDEGLVTDVKNQGSCGSCWIFGAVAALEGAYVLARDDKSQLTQFSEQQLLNCIEEYGCSGGWWPTAWKEVQTNNYIAKTDDVVYSASQNAEQCSRAKPNGIDGAQVVGWSVLRKSDAEEEMITNLLGYGPLAICIQVESAIYYYSGGVYDFCAGGTSCNHLVTLAGYTADTLLVKNSWGTSWGEAGYIRLARGCGTDGYSYWSSYVSLTATEDSSDDSDRSDTVDEEVQDEEVFEEIMQTTIDYVPGKKQSFGLDEKVRERDIFIIKGEDISASSKKWFVNLYVSSNIAYHLEFQRSDSVYRINSRRSNSWGSKSTGDYPGSVVEDGGFELQINITAEGYMSAINGETIKTFKHRLSPYDIDKIEVGGASATFTSIQQLRSNQIDASGSQVSQDMLYYSTSPYTHYSTPTGSPTTEAPTEAKQSKHCFDMKMYCYYWEEQGHCWDRTYGEYMKSFCPRSCNTC